MARRPSGKRSFVPRLSHRDDRATPPRAAEDAALEGIPRANRGKCRLQLDDPIESIVCETPTPSLRLRLRVPLWLLQERYLALLARLGRASEPTIASSRGALVVSASFTPQVQAA